MRLFVLTYSDLTDHHDLDQNDAVEYVLEAVLEAGRVFSTLELAKRALVRHHEQEAQDIADEETPLESFVLVWNHEVHVDGIDSWQAECAESCLVWRITERTLDQDMFDLTS